MKRYYSMIFLTWVCFILLQYPETASCLRASKESTRPKNKCLANITTSQEELDSPRTITDRHASCIVLNHPYCLDLKLPYNATIVPNHITDLNLRSLQEVKEYLEQWRGVQRLPKCWPILQVALCSLLMPQCDESTEVTSALMLQPSVDICNDLVKNDHCRFVERHLNNWPSIFNCSDSRIYGRNCSNDLRELRYAKLTNQKSTCQYPLVLTNGNRNSFRDIEGCALHCKYPTTNPDDQANITLIKKIFCLCGLGFTVLAITVLGVNKASSKSSRLAKVIELYTICRFPFYIGWSLQFIFNQEVGCNSDGSILYGQQLVANLCGVSFLLTYPTSLLSQIWRAYLGKQFYEKLTRSEERSNGSAELDRKANLFIYGITLTLLAPVFFFDHIDGQGLFGICTIGQRSVLIKTIFVFVPHILGTIYSNLYYLMCIFKLSQVDTHQMVPSLVRSHNRNHLRVSALVPLTMLETVSSMFIYLNELSNRTNWLDSIDEYVGCRIGLGALNETSDSHHELTQLECSIRTKPFITLYYIHLISPLLIDIVILSWIICESNYNGLKRKLIDSLEDEKDRRRRVRYFLKKEPEFAWRLADYMPTNRYDDDDDDQSINTYRDLIDIEDITKPSKGKEVSLGALTKGNRIDSGRRSGASLTRRVSIQTITSLRSVTITSAFDSESASMNGDLVKMMEERLKISFMSKLPSEHPIEPRFTHGFGSGIN